MAALWQQLPGTVWLAVLGFLALGLLSGVLRSAGVKGWLGERMVRHWLERDLDPRHYRCLHNVTLRLADGSTTQIDHVVLSPYGVFVVETKHLQGWIFGGEKQSTWTQTIFKRRHSFQNPLRQNWRHIKALEAVLQVPLAQLHSVVIFTGDCTFKTAMPDCVTQGRAGIRWIQQHNQVVWDAQEVERMHSTLLHTRLQPTRATHRAHVQQLHERHAKGPAVARVTMPSAAALARKVDPSASAVVAPPLAPAPVQEMTPQTQPVQRPLTSPPPSRVACPECGDELVRRSLPDSQGRARPFWRCTRFPHCRFVLADEVLPQQ